MIGDGGFQFSISELGTSVDANAPLVVIIWNNAGFGQIKFAMRQLGIVPEGVDLFTPDFSAIGAAFGYDVELQTRSDDLETILLQAALESRPTMLLGAESL